jgi:hypothetical protein
MERETSRKIQGMGGDLEKDFSKVRKRGSHLTPSLIWRDMYNKKRRR